MGTNREIIDVSVRGAGKAQSSLKKLGGAALKLGGAFFAAKGIVRGMSTIVQSGSKLKSVEMAFDNMGKKVGFSEGSLKKLQAATDGTVSKLELMTKANNAMALGIVESDDQMAQMFDTAQKLGKALGQDTASALDSLVTGMGRQSKLMLDNLGIMVDTQGAYDDYAESLGKTASQLTDSEKKTAFNNAAMAEATRIANEMGEEQLTTADKISKLKNTFADMAASVGSSADGMFSAVIDSAQGIADKVVAGLDFAKTIDWKATGQNMLDNGRVIFEALKEIMLLNFEFAVQNAKKALFKIPDAFRSLFSWLKDNYLPVLKEFWGKLFAPLVIGGKIMGQNMKLAFQIMWNDIKQMGVDSINFLLESYNKMASSFPRLNLPKATLIAEVDEDNLNETKEKIEGFKQELIETDIGGAIFGDPEEQIDTFGEYNEALQEIMTTMADGIIVQNEKIIESDNKVQENKENLAKKDKDGKKGQIKADKEHFDTGQKNFRNHLEIAASEFKAFQELNKAMKIRDVLIAIPKTVTDAYSAGMSVGGPFAPVVASAFAATALAAQMAQLKQIKKAQYGADFITDGPQMMMVGEGGAGTREHVQVTPLDDPNIDGPQGQGLTVNVSGNVMSDDFVESTLVEKIRESLRLGENMGV